MPPVARVEEDEVGAVAGCDAAAVGQPEDVRGVHGARRERLLGSEAELRAGERADDREALAVGAAGVEVRRERDRRARVGERAAGRHRAVQVERGDREQHADDVARGQRRDALRARGLEVVDRARAELDRQPDRADLVELVAVEPQGEPGPSTGLEVSPGLLDVERPALDEHVRRRRDPRGVREDRLDRPVDVRVGVRMLRRHRVRPEPRRDPARSRDRCELCELRVVVEAVAALPLERRRAVRQHRVAVPDDDLLELVRPRSTRRARRREDPATGRQQLLVRGPTCPQRELVRPVARERRVRVAVDEPGHDGDAPAVELLDLPLQPRQLAHRADGLDHVVVEQDERVLDELERPERRTTEWRGGAGRRRDLGDVADQDPPRARHRRPAVTS